MGTGFHTREVRTGNKAVLQFLTLVIDTKTSQLMGISFVLLCFELEKEFLWSRYLFHKITLVCFSPEKTLRWKKHRSIVSNLQPMFCCSYKS